MKIKLAVDNMLKNLGLEMHNVALDSLTEMEHLTILATLMQLNKDMLHAELAQIDLRELKEQEKYSEILKKQLNEEPA